MEHINKHPAAYSGTGTSAGCARASAWERDGAKMRREILKRRPARRTLVQVRSTLWSKSSNYLCLNFPA